MREGMSDVGQRHSTIRKHVIEFLRQRQRRALFVTELSASLRKANAIGDNEMKRALSELEAEGVVLVRDQYCADPHLEGVDLRVVALVEPSTGEDPQSRSIRAIEDTWNEWLALYLATHRCS